MEQHQKTLINETEWTSESGQAVIPLLLVLSLFLLAMFGFAVDLTNAWFHRQAASAAADAACEAGGMDMLSIAAGVTPTGAGFTPPNASNCVSSPSATMCTYAKDNGYSGAGLVTNKPSNSVSWSFLSSVPGVTAGAGTNSFLQVVISENVPAYFMRLLTKKPVLNINVSATCGVASVMSPAPMIVLDPTDANSFYYTGGADFYILGGPQRSLQVNSSSSSAFYWHASAFIDTSHGGPNQTGSDVAVVGGPTTAPGSGSGFVGGTTGSWKSGVLPIPDPYATVPVPAKVKTQTPSTGIGGTTVAHYTDGCPDPNGCLEFAPGYYPTGLCFGKGTGCVGNGSTTIIFLPGVYYLNGSLNAGNSNTLRVAVPTTGSQQTDGVMFYFYTGSFNVSGCSGCTNTNIDNVPLTRLTCDGSTPSTAIGLPTSGLTGNVLYGQCTKNGTYWDSFGDTSDSRGSPGVRGLLFFQDHSDTTSPTYSGSGALAFSGALYFHSTVSNTPTQLVLSGGSTNGTFILGEIITDQVSLTGSGAIKLALNPAPSVNLAKVGMF